MRLSTWSLTTPELLGGREYAEKDLAISVTDRSEIGVKLNWMWPAMLISEDFTVPAI